MKKRNRGKSHDSVGTPKIILDFVKKLFKNDTFYDPCPLNEDWTVNGLTQDWTKHSNIFVNPPYSCVRKWVNKAAKSFQEGPNINKIIMLIKAENLGNKYFLDLHKICNVHTLCYKIKFVGYNRKCGFSSIILEFSRKFQGQWTVVALDEK